jgi:hypothetical protein
MVRMSRREIRCRSNGYRPSVHRQYRGSTVRFANKIFAQIKQGKRRLCSREGKGRQDVGSAARIMPCRGFLAFQPFSLRIPRTATSISTTKREPRQKLSLQALILTLTGRSFWHCYLRKRLKSVFIQHPVARKRRCPNTSATIKSRRLTGTT